MKLANIQNQEVRCSDGLIMIAHDFSPQKWCKVPLLCSRFWDKYEKVIDLAIVASEDSKILELHFSVCDVHDQPTLDEMATFIQKFFR